MKDGSEIHTGVIDRSSLCLEITVLCIFLVVLKSKYDFKATKSQES